MLNSQIGKFRFESYHLTFEMFDVRCFKFKNLKFENVSILH